MTLADTTGLGANGIVVATLAIGTLALLLVPVFWRYRRTSRRLAPPPLHGRVLPPDPPSAAGPYDPGAFTIGPDERNPR